LRFFQKKAVFLGKYGERFAPVARDERDFRDEREKDIREKRDKKGRGERLPGIWGCWRGKGDNTGRAAGGQSVCSAKRP